MEETINDKYQRIIKTGEYEISRPASAVAREMDAIPAPAQTEATELPVEAAPNTVEAEVSPNPQQGENEAVLTPEAQAAIITRQMRVIDGDTIVKDGTTYRIRRVDAPEKDQPHGEESRRFLEETLKSGNVEIVPVEKDKYGRTIADVFVDGENVSLQLVKSGNAWHYDYWQKGDSSEFYEAQEQARTEASGLHSQDALEPNIHRKTTSHDRELDTWRRVQKYRREQMKNIMTPEAVKAAAKRAASLVGTPSEDAKKLAPVYGIAKSVAAIANIGFGYESRGIDVEDIPVYELNSVLHELRRSFGYDSDAFVAEGHKDPYDAARKYVKTAMDIVRTNEKKQKAFKSLSAKEQQEAINEAYGTQRWYSHDEITRYIESMSIRGAMENAFLNGATAETVATATFIALSEFQNEDEHRYRLSQMPIHQARLVANLAGVIRAQYDGNFAAKGIISFVNATEALANNLGAVARGEAFGTPTDERVLDLLAQNLEDTQIDNSDSLLGDIATVAGSSLPAMGLFASGAAVSVLSGGSATPFVVGLANAMGTAAYAANAYAEASRIPVLEDWHNADPAKVEAFKALYAVSAPFIEKGAVGFALKPLSKAAKATSFVSPKVAGWLSTKTLAMELAGAQAKSASSKIAKAIALGGKRAVVAGWGGEVLEEAASQAVLTGGGMFVDPTSADGRKLYNLERFADETIDAAWMAIKTGPFMMAPISGLGVASEYFGLNQQMSILGPENRPNILEYQQQVINSQAALDAKLQAKTLGGLEMSELESFSTLNREGRAKVLEGTTDKKKRYWLGEIDTYLRYNEDLGKRIGATNSVVPPTGGVVKPSYTGGLRGVANTPKDSDEAFTPKPDANQSQETKPEQTETPKPEQTETPKPEQTETPKPEQKPTAEPAKDAQVKPVGAQNKPTGAATPVKNTTTEQAKPEKPVEKKPVATEKPKPKRKTPVKSKVAPKLAKEAEKKVIKKKADRKAEFVQEDVPEASNFDGEESSLSLDDIIRPLSPEIDAAYGAKPGEGAVLNPRLVSVFKGAIDEEAKTGVGIMDVFSAVYARSLLNAVEDPDKYQELLNDPVLWAEAVVDRLTELARRQQKGDEASADLLERIYLGAPLQSRIPAQRTGKVEENPRLREFAEFSKEWLRSVFGKNANIYFVEDLEGSPHQDHIDIVNEFKANGRINAFLDLNSGNVYVSKKANPVKVLHEVFGHATWQWMKNNDKNGYEALKKLALNAPQWIQDKVARVYGKPDPNLTGKKAEEAWDEYLDEVFAHLMEAKYQGRVDTLFQTYEERAWYERFWEIVSNAIKRLWKAFSKSDTEVDPEELLNALSERFFGHSGIFIGKTATGDGSRRSEEEEEEETEEEKKKGFTFEDFQSYFAELEGPNKGVEIDEATGVAYLAGERSTDEFEESQVVPEYDGDTQIEETDESEVDVGGEETENTAPEPENDSNPEPQKSVDTVDYFDRDRDDEIEGGEEYQGGNYQGQPGLNISGSIDLMEGLRPSYLLNERSESPYNLLDTVGAFEGRVVDAMESLGLDHMTLIRDDAFYQRDYGVGKRKLEHSTAQLHINEVFLSKTGTEYKVAQQLLEILMPFTSNPIRGRMWLTDELVEKMQKRLDAAKKLVEKLKEGSKTREKLDKQIDAFESLVGIATRNSQSYIAFKGLAGMLIAHLRPSGRRIGEADSDLTSADFGIWQDYDTRLYPQGIAQGLSKVLEMHTFDEIAGTGIHIGWLAKNYVNTLETFKEFKEKYSKSNNRYVRGFTSYVNNTIVKASKIANKEFKEERRKGRAFFIMEDHNRKNEKKITFKEAYERAGKAKQSLTLWDLAVEKTFRREDKIEYRAEKSQEREAAKKKRYGKKYRPPSPFKGLNPKFVPVFAAIRFLEQDEVNRAYNKAKEEYENNGEPEEDKGKYDAPYQYEMTRVEREKFESVLDEKRYEQPPNEKMPQREVEALGVINALRVELIRSYRIAKAEGRVYTDTDEYRRVLAARRVLGEAIREHATSRGSRSEEDVKNAEAELDAALKAYENVAGNLGYREPSIVLGEIRRAVDALVNEEQVTKMEDLAERMELLEHRRAVLEAEGKPKSDAEVSDDDVVEEFKARFKAAEILVDEAEREGPIGSGFSQDSGEMYRQVVSTSSAFKNLYYETYDELKEFMRFEPKEKDGVVFRYDRSGEYNPPEELKELLAENRYATKDIKKENYEIVRAYLESKSKSKTKAGGEIQLRKSWVGWYNTLSPAMYRSLSRRIDGKMRTLAELKREMAANVREGIPAYDVENPGPFDRLYMDYEDDVRNAAFEQRNVEVKMSERSNDTPRLVEPSLYVLGDGKWPQKKPRRYSVDEDAETQTPSFIDDYKKRQASKVIDVATIFLMRMLLTGKNELSDKECRDLAYTYDEFLGGTALENIIATARLIAARVREEPGVEKLSDDELHELVIKTVENISGNLLMQISEAASTVQTDEWRSIADSYRRKVARFNKTGRDIGHITLSIEDLSKLGVVSYGGTSNLYENNGEEGPKARFPVDGFRGLRHKVFDYIFKDKDGNLVKPTPELIAKHRNTLAWLYGKYATDGWFRLHFSEGTANRVRKLVGQMRDFADTANDVMQLAARIETILEQNRRAKSDRSVVSSIISMLEPFVKDIDRMRALNTRKVPPHTQEALKAVYEGMIEISPEELEKKLGDVSGMSPEEVSSRLAELKDKVEKQTIEELEKKKAEAIKDYNNATGKEGKNAAETKENTAKALMAFNRQVGLNLALNYIRLNHRFKDTENPEKSAAEISDSLKKIHDTVSVMISEGMKEVEEHTEKQNKEISEFIDIVSSALSEGKSGNVQLDDEKQSILNTISTKIGNLVSSGFTLKQRLDDILRYLPSDKKEEVRKRFDEFLNIPIAAAESNMNEYKLDANKALSAAVLRVYGKPGETSEFSTLPIFAMLNQQIDEFKEFSATGRKALTRAQLMNQVAMLSQDDVQAPLVDLEEKLLAKEISWDELSENAKVMITRLRKLPKMIEALRSVSDGKDLKMIDELVKYYASVAPSLDAVAMKITGAPVTVDASRYYPVRRDTKYQAGGLNRSSQVIGNVPDYLSPRENTVTDIAEDKDIFNVFWDQTEQNAHFMAFGELHYRLSTLFNNDKWTYLMSRMLGTDKATAVKNHVQDIVAPRLLFIDNSEENSFWVMMRKAVSLVLLGGNLLVGLKQVTSISAFAHEIGWWKLARALFKNVNMFSAEMTEIRNKIFNAPEANARWKSWASDIQRDIMTRVGKGNKMATAMSFYMAFQRMGDFVPSYFVAPGVFYASYHSLRSKINPDTGVPFTEAEAEKRAREMVFDMIEKTQQTSRVSNMSHTQRRGQALGQLWTQFASSQILFASAEVRALRDVAANPKDMGNWKKLSGILISNHVVMPAFLSGLDMLARMALQDDEPDEEDLKQMMQMMAMGPASGIAILGSILFNDRYGDVSAPAVSFAGRIVKNVKKLGEHAYDEEYDKLLEDVHKLTKSLIPIYRDTSKVVESRILNDED